MEHKSQQRGTRRTGNGSTVRAVKGVKLEYFHIEKGLAAFLFIRARSESNFPGLFITF